MKAFNKSIVDEFRTNDGKVGGQFEGANLLLLTTTGAKSGQPRLAPLAYFTIDGKTIIIGSKAGADTNPDWVHNLRANPRAHIEVGTDAYDVTSRELPHGRARRDLRQGRRRGAGLRRIPGEHQPGHPAVRTRAGLAAAVKRLSASAIRARIGSPEITTSTIVSDWWVWPRARTSSVGTPAASSAAA